MSAIKLLVHLFLPHESNNQKAKLIHSSSLWVLALAMVGIQLLMSFAGRSLPGVLGYAANISPAEVISLTNAQRSANGLAPLSENSSLSSAALAKGNDMLAKGYWAHFAPDGTSPWSFFLSFGYKYQYAGENLARDFSDPGSAVTAWMNSPSHKENILNPKYKEIGIGVVEGSLSGADTTIIVQFFGTKVGSTAQVIPEAQAREATVTATAKPTARATIKPTAIPTQVPTATPIPTFVPTEVPRPTPQNEASTKPLISPFSSTKNISLGVVGTVLFVLSLDLILVRRKRIARIGGRTLAHIAYLGMILAVILILKAGQII